jgi:Ala-tRNA(Pro) deacylase
MAGPTWFLDEGGDMTTLTRILDYLDRGSIRYVHSTHPAAFTAREVAAVEHIPLHKLAKTVVFASEKGYGMAVVAADAFVDFEELRMLLGVPALRLATEEELAELFRGCELGAMPPLGDLFGLPVYFDRGLMDDKFIAFNAGTHRDLVHMSLEDLLRLARPVIGEFTLRVESSAGF